MSTKVHRWWVVAVFFAALTPQAWAQPAVLGSEFQVNQRQVGRQVAPVAAFSPAGHSLIVWEHDLDGILGRFYDHRGVALSGDITLVANRRLPTIPASGEVWVRKDPSVVFVPGGDFFLFWTEEHDYLVVDYFYENRRILDQDVRGQRFSAAGKPIGASFLVSETASRFERRPQAVLRAGGVMVAWESGAGWRDADRVSARFLNRRGQPRGPELRIDGGDATELREIALAASSAGDLLVVWEAEHGNDPDVVGRLLDRRGVLGPEITVHSSTIGRQRRPAVLANRRGEFLVAWQSFVSDGPDHGIYDRLFDAEGNPISPVRQVSQGVGEVQIAPALALLSSGKFVVTWMDWTNNVAVGVFAAITDDSGNPRGSELKISQGRVYPQYRTAVAANADGQIVATWESTIGGRAIAARRLHAD